MEAVRGVAGRPGQRALLHIREGTALGLILPGADHITLAGILEYGVVNILGEVRLIGADCTAVGQTDVLAVNHIDARAAAVNVHVPEPYILPGQHEQHPVIHAACGSFPDRIVRAAEKTAAGADAHKRIMADARRVMDPQVQVVQRAVNRARQKLVQHSCSACGLEQIAAAPEGKAQGTGLKPMMLRGCGIDFHGCLASYPASRPYPGGATNAAACGQHKLLL
ncbi:hypothetical protein D3C75_846660 [compost metagenome]